MPTYIACFRFTLRSPIDVDNCNLPPMKLSTGASPSQVTSVSPVYENAKIVALSVQVAYSSPDLKHSVLAGLGPEHGIALMTPAGMISSVWTVVGDQIAPLLYHLSGITLQESVYWDVLANWRQYVEDYWWQMPDGTKAPPFPEDLRLDPIRVMRVLPGYGKRALTQTDWKEIENAFAGRGNGAPLWRLLLSEAHRDRLIDRRNVVLRCAMALDVGISALLPNDDEFKLDVLRKERNGYKTPDLRVIDPALYDTVERLWYTRHAIMHKGQFHVYDKRPGPGIQPLHPIRDWDVDEFLCAVPKAIEFVSLNPP